ncbi:MULTISPECIES: acetyl-CoA carboxylase biotin carboxyl carrier protein [Clostridia]|uniref:acetyl-CoA carboxylase biotin carboxyl carrier protein n=1 Tax=Clostridia TaxID=186801 RepID=UPI00067F3A9F|nr:MULTISPECIES: acetyl-CoA carboxylase biotin carboxyl carrier protein [Clostridia]
MKIDEILQLVDAVSKSTLTEFKYEEGAVKLSLKKTIKTVPAEAALEPVLTIQAPAAPNQPASSPANPAPAAAAASDPAGEETVSAPAAEGKIVKSPLVGTFYAAPSEDAAPFVNIGDSVKEGQVLAIVEAMKLMNDIESDYAGTVAEVLVENGDTVEYGQPLFVIK